MPTKQNKKNHLQREEKEEKNNFATKFAQIKLLKFSFYKVPF